MERVSLCEQGLQQMEEGNRLHTLAPQTLSEIRAELAALYQVEVQMALSEHTRNQSPKPKAKKQLILLSTLRVSSARKNHRKKLLRNASNLLRGPRPRTIWLRLTRLL